MAITPADIAVALGRTVPETTSPTYMQWEMWIADAENAVAWRSEDLGVAGTLDQEKVDLVVRKAVVAHARHPDDATQVSTSIDDGSSQRTYKSSPGEVSIKDEWWALLGLIQDGALGSFRLYGEPDATPSSGSWA